MTFRDDFSATELDRAVWLPHYLPAWSSRDDTRASYELTTDGLRLFIPRGAGLWCPQDHAEPIRVSGIQSGNRSGSVGSSDGQQRFKDGLRVREYQPRLEGWLPQSGSVTVRCRMELSARSMAAMWLSGFEDRPEDSGELCVVEVFGRSIEEDGSAEIGVGIKRLYDSRLRQDFVAPRLPLDVAGSHDYTVRWSADAAEFLVDGRRIHYSAQGPGYPMQIMIAVFDFPNWTNGDDDHVPELVVNWIEGDTTSVPV